MGWIAGVLRGRNVSPPGGCPNSADGLAPRPGFATNIKSVPSEVYSVLVWKFNFPLRVNSKGSFHEIWKA
jgi:hypothetical protein